MEDQSAGSGRVETQSAESGRAATPLTDELASRLSVLRLNLARYQQLKTNRLVKLTADITASHNLLTCLTAKVKALEEQEDEHAIRQVISCVADAISSPVCLERFGEIERILSDVEEQCEHCCELYDDVPLSVSRSTSPRSGATTPLYGKHVTRITLSPPDDSMPEAASPLGSTFKASPPGKRSTVSPVGGSSSAVSVFNGRRSIDSRTNGGRRAVFSLDGSSGSGDVSPPDDSTSGRPLTPTRRSLVRSVASACSRRLRRSGSLPARLLQPTIPAPLPAPVRPRFLLQFSTDGNSGGGARVVVETRPEVAPLLARLFAAGCAGPYRGAPVLRCVPGWWLQAGPADSAAAGEATAVCRRLAETHAPRLETRPGAVELLSARLGAVEDGDEAGGGSGWLLGPQFFLHLRSYSFTNVLGYVVEGLEQVARLASSGDPRAEYTPRRTVTISQCGPLPPD